MANKVGNSVTRTFNRMKSLIERDGENFYKYTIGDRVADIREELVLLSSMSNTEMMGKKTHDVLVGDIEVFKKVIKTNGESMIRGYKDRVIYQVGLFFAYTYLTQTDIAFRYGKTETKAFLATTALIHSSDFIAGEDVSIDSFGKDKRGITRIMMDNIMIWYKQLDIEKWPFKKEVGKSIYWKLDSNGAIGVGEYREAMRKGAEEFGEVYASWKLGEISEKEISDTIKSDYGRVDKGILGDYSLNQRHYMGLFKETSVEEYYERYNTPELRKVHQVMVDSTMDIMMEGKADSNFREYMESMKVMERYQTYRKKYKEMDGKIQEERERSKEKEKVLMAEFKGLRKRLGNMDKAIREVENERNKALNGLKSLTDGGVKSTRPLEIEIEKLRNELEEKKSLLVGYERNVGKYRAEMERANEAYGRLQNSYKEVVSKLDELTRVNNELMMNGNGFDIPIESVLKALRNKKIGIVGGNPMHPYINNLGEKNIVVYDGFSKLNGTMNQLDLVVFVTGTLSHKVTFEVKSIADKKGIDVYNFNGQNVGQLFKEVFAYLHRN